MDPNESIEERLNSALADRYRVEGEIGRGGMATVYLAIGGGVEVPGLGQLPASWAQVQGNQALEKPLPCPPRGSTPSTPAPQPSALLGAATGKSTAWKPSL